MEILLGRATFVGLFKRPIRRKTDIDGVDDILSMRGRRKPDEDYPHAEDELYGCRNLWHHDFL